MKLFISGAFTTVVALLAVGLALIYSGTYNVAADRDHTAFEAWLLSTGMIRSIKAHGGHETPPADLNDERRIRDGSHLFEQMCVQCHGAPGKKPGEVGLGLRPQPPDLAKFATRWNTAQMFWIVKHGIVATGMPAFGGTHTENQLWDLVAFVEKLPQLSPEQYRAKGETTGSPHDQDHQRDHTHDHQHEH